MESHVHVPKIRKAPTHWLLEGHQELAARVLKSLQSELEHNLSTLEGIQYTEQLLVRLYKQHLPAVRAAAER